MQVKAKARYLQLTKVPSKQDAWDIVGHMFGGGGVRKGSKSKGVLAVVQKKLYPRSTVP